MTWYVRQGFLTIPLSCHNGRLIIAPAIDFSCNLWYNSALNPAKEGGDDDVCTYEDKHK